MDKDQIASDLDALLTKHGLLAITAVVYGMDGGSGITFCAMDVPGHLAADTCRRLSATCLQESSELMAEAAKQKPSGGHRRHYVGSKH